MSADAPTVAITRVFKTSVDALYRAWIDPSSLERWLAPGSNRVVSVVADVRVGGAFRLDMLDANGVRSAFSGVYTAIVARALIAMTWRYEGPAEALAHGNSVLCVRFRPIDAESAELRLEHALVEPDVSPRAYRLGWATCFDKLDGVVSPSKSDKRATFSYSAGQRAAQHRYGTEALARTLGHKLVRPSLSDEDAAFIARRDMLFLSTVDDAGMPTVSYKGGATGFATVDRGEVVFPSYDGNGMCLSIGNITERPNVGLLFVDFEVPQRLRVQGNATIDDGPSKSHYPGAVCVIRIVPTAVFSNCARYVHPMRRVESSAYIPDESGDAPFPAWKRINEVVESLPERDRERALELGIIDVERYRTMLREGMS